MEDLIHAFGIDWKLMLAQSINFLIVLVALGYLVYTPVFKLLRERADVVAKGLDDAEKAAAERATAAEERSGILAEAHRESERVMQRAIEEAAAARAAELRTAAARAEQLVRDAEAAASERARAILEEGEKEIARTAVLAAEKILSKV